MQLIKQKLLKTARYIINNSIFSVFILTFLIVHTLKHKPHFTELVYSKSIYPIIATISSHFSSLFNFSVNDLFYLLTISTIIFFVIKLIVVRLNRRKTVINIAKVLAFVYILFYWLWGFNYFRDNIYQRLELNDDNISQTEFTTSLNCIITKTIKNYNCNYKFDLIAVDSTIEYSYKQLSKYLKIPYSNGKRQTKNITASRFFAGAFVGGYFGPFFNEVHINSYLLPIQIPIVLAHEKAHQFGITDEGEANFIGWLVCQNTNDSYIEYSANLYVLIYFLQQIKNSEQYNAVIKTIPSEIISDINNIKQYWNNLRNPNIDNIQTKLNNWYLKNNSIEQGIDSYQGVVKMICSYHKNIKF